MKLRCRAGSRAPRGAACKGGWGLGRRCSCSPCTVPRWRGRSRSALGVYLCHVLPKLIVTATLGRQCTWLGKQADGRLRRVWVVGILQRGAVGIGEGLGGGSRWGWSLAVGACSRKFMRKEAGAVGAGRGYGRGRGHHGCWVVVPRHDGDGRKRAHGRRCAKRGRVDIAVVCHGGQERVEHGRVHGVGAVHGHPVRQVGKA